MQNKKKEEEFIDKKKWNRWNRTNITKSYRQLICFDEQTLYTLKTNLCWHLSYNLNLELQLDTVFFRLLTANVMNFWSFNETFQACFF